eukprot:366567-Chlamydomonas_euryale.AAC.4
MVLWALWGSETVARQEVPCQMCTAQAGSSALNANAGAGSAGPPVGSSQVLTDAGCGSGTGRACASSCGGRCSSRNICGRLEGDGTRALGGSGSSNDEGIAEISAARPHVASAEGMHASSAEGLHAASAEGLHAVSAATQHAVLAAGPHAGSAAWQHGAAATELHGAAAAGLHGAAATGLNSAAATGLHDAAATRLHGAAAAAAPARGHAECSTKASTPGGATEASTPGSPHSSGRSSIDAGRSAPDPGHAATDAAFAKAIPQSLCAASAAPVPVGWAGLGQAQVHAYVNAALRESRAVQQLVSAMASSGCPVDRSYFKVWGEAGIEWLGMLTCRCGLPLAVRYQPRLAAPRSSTASLCANALTITPAPRCWSTLPCTCSTQPSLFQQPLCHTTTTVPHNHHCATQPPRYHTCPLAIFCLLSPHLTSPPRTHIYTPTPATHKCRSYRATPTPEAASPSSMALCCATTSCKAMQMWRAQWCTSWCTRLTSVASQVWDVRVRTCARTLPRLAQNSGHFHDQCPLLSASLPG